MATPRHSAVERGRFRAATPAEATQPTDSARRESADEAGRSSTTGSDLPGWFHLGVLVAVVLIATVGSFGLMLAINAAYHTWLVLLVAVPLTAVLVAGLWPGRARATVTRAGQVGAALALVIAIGYAAFASATPSQHVILNRDPGAYEVAGRWIARSGSIDVDAKDTAFEGIDGLVYRSAGLYNVPAVSVDAQGRADKEPSGNLQFQFNHLASAVLASAYDVGGWRLMFRAPAIVGALGLLLVYAVASRATRRPLLSLTAPLLLAAAMPMLFVVRDTFSEPFALVLLWGGLLVLLDAHEQPRPWVGIVGGVLLGSVAATRVDALVYVILFFPLAAVSIGAASPGPRRRARLVTWAIAIVTTAAVGAIGWVDLYRHTGGYADDLSADLTRLRHALAASVVISVLGLLVWVFVPALRRVARRIQRPGAWLVAALVVLVVLGLWLIRPLVEVARPSLTVSPTMRTTNAIQRRQGLKVEPRSYAEHSLWWMAWYLGIPALVAAIAGFGTAAWQTVRGRATAATTAVGVLTLGGGAVYWWDPSITPVQLWASRRFMPAVFPGLSVMVVVALAVVVTLPIVRRQTPALRGVAAGALLAVLVLPAAVTTWPLRWQRSQGGFLQPVLDTCDGMDGNPAVVLAGNYESLALQQTLRSWCGVPVAAQGSALDGGPSAQELASTLKARGYDLYLVGANESTMDRWATAVGSVSSASVGVWDRHAVQETVDRAPQDYAPARRVFPLDGPFQLFWVPVEPTTR